MAFFFPSGYYTWWYSAVLETAGTSLSMGGSELIVFYGMHGFCFFIVNCYYLKLQDFQLFLFFLILSLISLVVKWASNSVGLGCCLLLNHDTSTVVSKPLVSLHSVSHPAGNTHCKRHLQASIKSQSPMECSHHKCLGWTFPPSGLPAI